MHAHTVKDAAFLPEAGAVLGLTAAQAEARVHAIDRGRTIGDLILCRARRSLCFKVGEKLQLPGDEAERQRLAQEFPPLRSETSARPSSETVTGRNSIPDDAETRSPASSRPLTIGGVPARGLAGGAKGLRVRFGALVALTEDQVRRRRHMVTVGRSMDGMTICRADLELFFKGGEAVVIIDEAIGAKAFGDDFAGGGVLVAPPSAKRADTTSRRPPAKAAPAA